jgi:hypothetical protein
MDRSLFSAQTACIKEVLRMGNPLPGRLPRVVPPEGFDLYGHHVPGGVSTRFRRQIRANAFCSASSTRLHIF